MGALDTIMTLGGLLGGADTATDRTRPTDERVAGGMSTAGSLLSGAGELASGVGLTALGNVSLGTLPVLGAGAMTTAAGGVLGAGALGFGLGRSVDNLVGRASSALGGDGRNLSDRIGDGMYSLIHGDEPRATHRGL